MWRMRVKKLIDKAAKARADHRARHRPTGFGFAFADSIDFVDPAKWDRLTSPNSIFLQRTYLRVLEAHGPANIRQRYAMIFRGAEPVAAVTAQIAAIRGAALVNTQDAAVEGKRVKRAIKSASGKIKTRALEKVRAEVLVCGNLLSWGMHCVAFAKGEQPAEVWPAVAEALYRIRRSEKLSSRVSLVMIKDIPAESAADAASLKRFSYEVIEPEPDMVLALRPEWKTHNDYLASIGGKYRKGVTKVFEQVDAAGYRVEREKSLNGCAEQLHALYMQVHEHAAVRLFTLPPMFIPALAEAMGGAFRCTMIRKGSDIAGFVTTLKDGDTAMGYYVGFDRAANQEVPLYFRLLQAVVADALDLGCRRLSLGRTALDPKARLGARPEPLQVWLRHRQPVFNTLMRPLLGLVPHHEAPERNPFK